MLIDFRRHARRGHQRCRLKDGTSARPGDSSQRNLHQGVSWPPVAPGTRDGTAPRTRVSTRPLCYSAAAQGRQHPGRTHGTEAPLGGPWRRLGRCGWAKEPSGNRSQRLRIVSPGASRRVVDLGCPAGFAPIFVTPHFSTFATKSADGGHNTPLSRVLKISVDLFQSCQRGVPNSCKFKGSVGALGGRTWNLNRTSLGPATVITPARRARCRHRWRKKGGKDEIPARFDSNGSSSREQYGLCAIH
jgi:hypothetical protein